jgi:hypothetical protein
VSICLPHLRRIPEPNNEIEPYCGDRRECCVGSAAVTYGLRPAAPTESHAVENRDNKASAAATDAEHDKPDAHEHAEKDAHAGDRVEMAESTIKTTAIEIATAGPASLIGKEPLPGEIRFNPGSAGGRDAASEWRRRQRSQKSRRSRQKRRSASSTREPGLGCFT